MQTGNTKTQNGENKFSAKDFQWVDYYQEFAQKLRDYKDDRKPLIAKVFEVFDAIKMKLPKLENNNQIVDIDPFTIFGLFNKTSMREENRRKILASIAEIFGLSSTIPEEFFVPVLNPLNASYYRFDDERKVGDIDLLWDLFSTALDYAEEPSEAKRAMFSDCFKEPLINIQS